MSNITIAQRFGRAAAVGAAGFAVAFSIMIADGGFQTDYSFLRVATAGAFLSGLLFAGTFGGRGAWGWFCSGLGFGCATVVGAIIAVMLLPLDEVLMHSDILGNLRQMPASGLLGPVYVLSMLVENQWVAMAWVGAYSGVHALATRYAALNP